MSEGISSGGVCAKNSWALADATSVPDTHLRAISKSRRIRITNELGDAVFYIHILEKGIHQHRRDFPAIDATFQPGRRWRSTSICPVLK